MTRFASTVARNAAAGVAAQFAIKILSFTFTVLVIRRLGVETYGQYAAVTAFGALFVSFADLGLSPYTVREVARVRDSEGGPERVRGLLADVLWMRLLLAAAAAALILLTGWLTNRPPAMMLGLALGAIGLLIYGVQGAFEAVVTGSERLDWMAGARVLQQLCFVLLGAIALLLGLSYHSLILANTAGIIVLTLITVQAARRVGLRVGRTEIARWGPLLRAAIPFGIIGLTLGLSYKFDSVLLNLFRGDAETGLYNAAYTLIFSVVVLSNILNLAIFPSLTRENARDPERLPVVAERVLSIYLMVTLPIAVGGSLLAVQIVGLLYGADFAAAALPLAILAWVIPLMFLTEFMGYIIVIQGTERRVAAAIAVSTTFNVLLNLLLIPRFGLPAAAIMTVATEAVLLAQYLYALRPLVRKMRWRQATFKPLAASLVMGVVVWALRGLPLPLTILIGALVYLGGLWLTGALGPAELAMARALLRRDSLPPPLVDGPPSPKSAGVEP